MKPNRQPFQDIVDTTIFFGGGARREIVDDIKAALNADVQLLTLTGTDGSGKTMLCRMVEQELKDSAEVLFFDQGAESFDEVVNRIAAQVEFEDTEEVPDRNTQLEKAVEILNRQNRRLIIILDGAEKIFLATLERIRRMIDQVNTERLALQVLFSGRPLFALNFKQLGIINFKIVEEKHFSLDPLDGKNTNLYLNHCLDVSDTAEQKRFSLAQAVEIADIARGNFRLINQLAGKFLDLKRLASENDAASEDEYDDEGSDSPGLHSKLSAGLGNVDLDFLKVPRLGFRWYAAGAVIIALVLIRVLFWGGDEEESESIPGSENVPDLTLEKVEPDPIEIPQLSQPVEPLQPPSPAIAPEEPQLLVEKVRPSEVVAEVAEETGEESGSEVIADETVEDPVPAPQTAELKDLHTPSPEETQSSETTAEQLESQETQQAQEMPPAELIEPEEVVQIPEEAPVQVQEESAAAETVSEDEGLDVSSETVPVEVPAEQRQDPAAAENLLEEPATSENTVSAESMPVPKLTVLPKKKPSIESVPFDVVTLQSDSKKKPDQIAASAPPVETETAQRQTAASTPEEVQPPALIEEQVEPTVVVPDPEEVASIEETMENDSTLIPARPERQADANDSGAFYAQRLAAGSRWLVGGSRNKYTVQLMVLNSQDAQQNVRYMLSDKSYRPIVDQLYILRKSRQPQTVMLYWGEFDSPAEARQAKDQLPDFLSRLEPFEIPVKDAVAKARAGQ
ncbi:MAG: AAA family ATPase [Desulfocapsaceae bacterium]